MRQVQSCSSPQCVFPIRGIPRIKPYRQSRTTSFNIPTNLVFIPVVVVECHLMEPPVSIPEPVHPLLPPRLFAGGNPRASSFCMGGNAAGFVRYLLCRNRISRGSLTVRKSASLRLLQSPVQSAPQRYSPSSFPKSDPPETTSVVISPSVREAVLRHLVSTRCREICREFLSRPLIHFRGGFRPFYLEFIPVI